MSVAKKNAKIIVLAGQSNAVGVGYTKYLADHFSANKVAEFEAGYGNVRINFFSHNFGSDGFVDTRLGLAQSDKPTFGPEVGIAEMLTEDFGDEIFYIVKYAVGGTNLYHDWLSPSGRGEHSEDNSDKPSGYCYDGFTELLRKSIAMLEDDGYTPEIRAFCWMQGESDACEEHTAFGYIKRFDDLIKDFELEFSPYLKNYILADGGISAFWKYHKEINEMKREYATRADGRIYVDTIEAGLETEREPLEKPDLPHYDSGSVIALGRLFEQAIKGNLEYS